MPPLLVNIGGDRWVQPLGVYATTISHAIAPGFFAGRWASIFVASLNVALIFLVAWRLFARYLPALVAAIILMFTPAHFAFGRIGIDAIYVIPFILVWLYALLEFIDKDRPAAMAACRRGPRRGRLQHALRAADHGLSLAHDDGGAVGGGTPQAVNATDCGRDVRGNAGAAHDLVLPAPADLPGHLRTLGDFCGALAQPGGRVPGVRQHQHAGHTRLRRTGA